MIQMNYNNPANRLYFFLEEALKRNGGLGTRQTLQELLHTNDYISTLRSVAEMNALVEESVAASRLYYPTARVAQHWVSSVTAAFENIHMQGQWSGFTAYIDAHTMEYLHQLSHMLDAKMPSSKQTIEGVAKYRAELNDLLEEVLRSDEPKELKDFLAKSLQEIIATLDQYAVVGDNGVLAVVQKAVGAALTDSEIREKTKSSGLAKKTLTAIGRGVNAFSTAKTVAEAIEYFGNLLS